MLEFPTSCIFCNNHPLTSRFERQAGVNTLELEVVFRVVVADVFYHLLNAGAFVADVGDHAVFDVVTEDVTQRTTEVLMTRIREEGTAVGQHTN